MAVSFFMGAVLGAAGSAISRGTYKKRRISRDCRILAGKGFNTWWAAWSRSGCQWLAYLRERHVIFQECVNNRKCESTRRHAGHRHEGQLASNPRAVNDVRLQNDSELAQVAFEEMKQWAGAGCALLALPTSDYGACDQQADMS
jgi:hypothetical protein